LTSFQAQQFEALEKMARGRDHLANILSDLSVMKQAQTLKKPYLDSNTMFAAEMRELESSIAKFQADLAQAADQNSFVEVCSWMA
jgi:hypothetical protein